MNKIKSSIIPLSAILTIALVACSNGIQTPNEDAEPGPVTYTKVTPDMVIPWGMTWLPNGDMLVTEKEGKILVVRDGEILAQEIEGVPEIYFRGQGGLLDIELHPDFENNQWVYLSYASSEGSGSGGNTAIARAKLNGFTLTDHEVLYKATPNTTKGQHFGSRLEFDKDGYLYFSVGDRGNRDVNPQDVTRDGGKIYRINDDGTIPSDNPFVGTENAVEAAYSIGHRNPQGMAMHPETGKIWTHEHGPRGGDEVNMIEPGKNYGWPVISYGINYDGSSFTDITEKEGMEQPATYWDPSIAPSGMAFISSDIYPGRKGGMLVGSLKFNYIVYCEVDGNKVTDREIIAKEIGRVRNIKQGPDGYIYVAVESKGIYKLLPD